MSELEEAFQEIQRLRLENSELKKRLGLPDAAVHESPVDDSQETSLPSSLESEPLPKADSHSSSQDKINLFRVLFKGREDVYPALWMNQSTGKKGYSPACENPWVGKGKPKQYLPLTDQVVQDHLSGKKTIGVYPLLKDNTCRFLACDFDKAGWELDALAYLQSCASYGIPAYLEKSRSGNGGHAWVFFLAPVQALSARQLGLRLLRDTMEKRAEVDLASYDRFFPNQDFMPRGGFGNLIALPLQKQRRELGCTEFLDQADPEMKPYPDQWAFLSSVRRLSPGQLSELLEKIPAIEVGPQTAAKAVSPALKNKYPAPALVRCVLDASVSIEKSGLPPWLLSQIKHLASLHNPVFYERQNMRFSTYGIPRFIRCYGEDAAYLHFPRGTLEDLKKILEEAGSSVEITDTRLAHDPLKFKFQGELTANQEKAMKVVLQYESGVLVAPPGAGKTVMGCYAVARRNLPTLILSHRKPILDQWRAQLKRMLGLKSNQIGQVGGGRKRSTGVVDLAMIQSLKRMENLREFFSRYGFILVDECHVLPAVSFEQYIKQAPARYILGLTATPIRRDGLQDLIFMQCGPLRYRMAEDKEGLETTLKIRPTNFRFEQTGEEFSIQEIFRALAQDEARDRMIVEDVAQALSEGRKCLVLSQRKEHCHRLIELLREAGKSPKLLTGGMGKKERAAVLQEVMEATPDVEILLVATGQYLGEGFDCPKLDTLFLAFPISFKGKLIQYLGRVQRAYEGKKNAVVYDYLDDFVPVLKKMAWRRQKTYRSLGMMG
jgi:superfamily II DNA or RNA helicase